MSRSLRHQESNLPGKLTEVVMVTGGCGGGGSITGSGGGCPIFAMEQGHARHRHYLSLCLAGSFPW